MAIVDDLPVSTRLTAPAAASALRAFRLAGPDDPFIDNFHHAGAFQSGSFLTAIASTLCSAKGAELVLIAVEDAAARPVALFPFVRRRHLGAMVLEGLDFDVTDYFMPAGGATHQASGDIWRAVESALPRVDAVMFKKMPRNLHGRAHALTDAKFLKPMSASAQATYLRDSAGETVAPASLPVARDVRRKLRKLQSMGKVDFVEATSPVEIGNAMDTLVDFRVKRFENLGRRDILNQKEYRDFYHLLALSPDRLGRIFSLTVDGETVAIIYGLVHGDAVTLLIPSIAPDEKWQAASPGLIALHRLFEWASAGGYRVFDFSVGPAAYKARFNTEQVELFEYQRAWTLLGIPAVLEATLRRLGRRLAVEQPRLKQMLARLKDRLP